MPTPPTLTHPLHNDRGLYVGEMNNNWASQDSFNIDVAASLDARVSGAVDVLTLKFAGAVGGSFPADLDLGGVVVPFDGTVLSAFARFNTAPGGGTTIRVGLQTGSTALLGTADFTSTDAGVVKTLAGLNPLAAVTAGDWVRPHVSAVAGSPSAAADLSITVLVRRS